MLCAIHSSMMLHFNLCLKSLYRSVILDPFHSLIELFCWFKLQLICDSTWFRSRPGLNVVREHRAPSQSLTRPLRCMAGQWRSGQHRHRLLLLLLFLLFLLLGGLPGCWRTSRSCCWGSRGSLWTGRWRSRWRSAPAPHGPQMGWRWRCRCPALSPPLPLLRSHWPPLFPSLVSPPPHVLRCCVGSIGSRRVSLRLVEVGVEPVTHPQLDLECCHGYAGEGAGPAGGAGSWLAARRWTVDR